MTSPQNLAGALRARGWNLQPNVTIEVVGSALRCELWLQLSRTKSELADVIEFLGGDSVVQVAPPSRAVAELDRRVFAPEFRSLLGWGATWFRKQVARGVIPPGRRDCPGGRPWWLASEVRGVLRGLAATSRRSAS